MENIVKAYTLVLFSIKYVFISALHEHYSLATVMFGLSTMSSIENKIKKCKQDFKDQISRITNFAVNAMPLVSTEIVQWDPKIHKAGKLNNFKLFYLNFK